MDKFALIHIAIILLSSCSDREESGSLGVLRFGQSSPPATPAVFDGDGRLSGPGAPERFACGQESDCVISEIPTNQHPAPPPHLLGCCPVSGFFPMNRAYYDWIRSFQQQHCPADRSACPDLSAPAMPNPCVHQARCIEGRCNDACGR